MAEHAADGIWDGICEALEHLFRFGWAKYGLAAAIATFGKFVTTAPEPWRTALVASLVLMAVDFVSGITASVAVRRVRISSALAGRSLLKLGCYCGVLIIAGVVDATLHSPYTTTLLVLSIVAAREGLSALANIRLVWEKLGYKWPFDFLADRFHDGTAVDPARPYRNGDEK